MNEKEKARIKSLIDEYCVVSAWRRTHDWLDYVAENSEEIADFVMVEPSISGLGVAIYVDENMTYEEFEHPLWIYVDNGYARHCPKMAISVINTPLIMSREITYRIDEEVIEQVKEFIRNNCQLLKKLGNVEINYRDFIKEVKPINERKDLITEYRRLDPADSGLPCDIWVGDGGKFIRDGHWTRIKIPFRKGEWNTRNYAPLSIDDNPQLFGKTMLSNKELRQIKAFVVNNKDALNAVTMGEIGWETFLRQIRKQ